MRLINIDENWMKINEEYKKYIGTLVLDLMKVVLLEDIVDDRLDEDYSYKLYSLEKGKYYSSCVGPIHPLKGNIPDEDYDYILRVWNLNSPRKAR